MKPELEHQIVNSSPVYQRYTFEEELRHRQAKNAFAQEWPELLVKGSLNKQAQSWNDAFTGENHSYSAALVLNIPLFSGGSLISSYSEAMKAQHASELKAETEILHFKNEIENERLQMEALKTSLEAQKIALTQNDEIVRLSFKSYQLGKATMLELLGSQNELIDSKLIVAKTKLDLATLARRFAWNLGVKSL